MQPLAPHGALRGKSGKVETHKLAAEIDDDGKVYVFPTVVELEDGRLKKFKDNYEALKYNKEHKETIEFPDIDSAVKFTQSYKKHPLIKLLQMSK
jgi:hypothetical protein